jgi:hypothetical protein
VPEPQKSPEELIWDLLCEWYKLYGGDCANLPKMPAQPPIQTVQFMWDQYTNHGPPPLPNYDVKMEFLDILSQLEAKLAAEDNPWDATVTQSLLNLIAANRDDVT